MPRGVCRGQVLEVWQGVWVAFYVLWETMEGCKWKSDNVKLHCKKTILQVAEDNGWGLGGRVVEDRYKGKEV